MTTDAHETGDHVYCCTKCGTTIRSIIPYTTDPAPYHRHDMVFVERPLKGFSDGITACGPLVLMEHLPEDER